MLGFDTVLAGVFTLAGLAPLVLLRPALANRDKPGSTGFLFVLAGITLWSLGAAGLQVAGSDPVVMLAFALRMAGPLIAASGFFLLLAEYTGLLSPTRPVLGSILLLVVVIQALTWTNPLHHLVYGPELSLTEETIRFEKMGPVWVLNTVVSHGFNAAAFLLGVIEVLRTSAMRRQQTLTVLGAAIPPIGLNVLAQFWMSLSFDPTALGFVLTAFIMGWALYGGTFLDVVPVGRKRAIETMADPVVVIDDGGRIVDSNPAARDLVEAGEDWEGMAAAAFFEPFAEEFERFRDVTSIETEVSLTSGGTERHFDLRISPIRGPQERTRGRLVVLREVTARKERERELDLMRQVQSRVLRHNIRNELQVIRGHTQTFREALDGEYSEMAETVIERSDALIKTSNNTRAVEELLEKDQTPVEMDLAADLGELVETYRSRYPAVSFTFDAAAPCWVETTPAMEFAIENLIDNAAVHNDVADAEVTVSIVITDNGAVVTVADNGPGIPDQELAVLERGSETALSHGSGMGLWVVDWVVDHALASVSFKTGSTGTEITIRIPQADQGRSEYTSPQDP
jgi:PAS domain S-box-containing protein